MRSVLWFDACETSERIFAERASASTAVSRGQRIPSTCPHPAVGSALHRPIILAVSVLVHLIKWQLGLAPAESWTSSAERDCLARYAAGKRLLAEIGVWHGGTSCTLRTAMAADGTLYAIDPYPPGRLGFSIPRIVGRREVNRIRNGRVVWVRMSGATAGRSSAIQHVAPFDFIFVDDAQSYEALREEWETWAPLVTGRRDHRPARYPDTPRRRRPRAKQRTICPRGGA